MGWGRRGCVSSAEWEVPRLAREGSPAPRLAQRPLSHVGTLRLAWGLLRVVPTPSILSARGSGADHSPSPLPVGILLALPQPRGPDRPSHPPLSWECEQDTRLHPSRSPAGWVVTHQPPGVSTTWGRVGSCSSVFCGLTLCLLPSDPAHESAPGKEH